jgi:hypothetical protein
MNPERKTATHKAARPEMRKPPLHCHANRHWQCSLFAN